MFERSRLSMSFSNTLEKKGRRLIAVIGLYELEELAGFPGLSII
jgi:hypothetical protein